MVTGPLWDDLGVLQACRAYEEAAGPAWPSPALIGCLDNIGRRRRHPQEMDGSVLIRRLHSAHL